MSQRFQSHWLFPVLAFCSVSGCSQTASTPAAPDKDIPVAASAPANSGSDGDKVVSNLDCGKVFGQSDVAGILDGKVTIGVYPARDNACSFETESSSSINLYSGNGITNQVEWKAAAANGTGDFKPLAGVGDQAFYRALGAGRVEMFSKKGNDYCSVSGGSDHAGVAGEALAKKLGALCDKVYAVR